MICPQFRPLVGGYERAAERLSAALAEAGIEVVVVAERRERNWPRSELIQGYLVRRLRCWHRRRLHTPSSLLSFSAFLLLHGRTFDVWHVHQYGLHAALAVALGELFRRPVVLKLTNSGPLGILALTKPGILGRLLGFLHRRVSACIATTAETAEEAIQFGIAAERVHRIPNGLDGRSFRPATPEERMTARDLLGMQRQCIAITIGRLVSQKNHAGLLEAWSHMDPETRRRSLLAIVGEGPELSRLQIRVTELGISDCVCFPGHRSDTVNWYHAANLYVIASHHEGLSNSMIESLASGLPVVATAVSGTAEYLDQAGAGIVVPVGDMEALCSAVQTLLTSPEMQQKYGLVARRMFEENFAIRIIADKTIALYALLAAQSANSSRAEPA